MTSQIALLALTLLTQAPGSDVGRGRIQGGWDYVWTSYGIAAASMALYGLSLWRRTQAAKRERKETP